MELRKTINDVRDYIPANLRGNFDRNSKHLTIEFIEETVNQEYNQPVVYNFDTNTIYLNKNIMTRQESDDKSKHSLIKGLLLMSSTNYKKNKALDIGFGLIQRFGVFKGQNTISNIGLTTGYTELMACIIEGKNVECIKNYPLALFSKQIELIVGKEAMQEAYFKENKGQIEKILSKIDGKIDSHNLLESITNISQMQGIEYEIEAQDIQNKLEILFNQTDNCNKLKDEFKKYLINYEPHQKTKR